jgi:hypothetical protein
VNCVDERCSNRCDAEEQCRYREEPSGSHPLAAQVAGNLEDDIRDVEDRQDMVVIVAGQVKICIEPSESRVSC